jgi:tRNA pseudouridine55 synthase
MPNGIILLDKPRGVTSNGALQRLRKAYRARSAGHVGTLDPMATGMLPICLDEATKVIAEIEGGIKAYLFTVSLGRRTDTGDADGEIVEHRAVPALERPGVESVLAAFRGPQAQIPPMYSALKRQGRPLYELARQGVEVERAARQILIHDLRLLECEGDSLRLACECSKGTYIRVLGEDIARALGTVGHLVELRRAWVAPFREMPMVTLEAAVEGAGAGAGLLPADAALQFLPKVTLSASQLVQVRHGQCPAGASVAGDSPTRARLYGPDDAFVGIAEVMADGQLQPRRLLLPSGP